MKTFFQLEKHQTTIRTEMMAGFTTFFTMAYIIFVNPQILAKTGMDTEAVMAATCLSAGIGTLLIGLLANYPFAQAPGMGLNAFFTFSVVMGMGYTWQQALAVVFISGCLFITLTITGLRKTILEGIPLVIRHAIPAGIGFFIGFNNAGIIKVNQGPVAEAILASPAAPASNLLPQLDGLPPQVLEIGNLSAPSVTMAIIGLVIMAGLTLLRLKGALFLGIIATALVGLPLGVTQLPETFGFSIPDLSPTFLQLDFQGLLASDNMGFWGNFFTLCIIILSFSIVDLFDSIGTLIGTAEQGGFLDKEGKLPRINRALMSDGIATSIGALLGTSTVTTYIESGSGIAEGGKTGLVSFIVAILFFLAMFAAPILSFIPAVATAPALIMVGVFMMASLRHIDFQDYQQAIPAFLVISFMAFSYSIANGIAIGFIFYTISQTVTRKWDTVHPVVWVFSLLFLLKFIFA